MLTRCSLIATSQMQDLYMHVCVYGQCLIRVDPSHYNADMHSYRCQHVSEIRTCMSVCMPNYNMLVNKKVNVCTCMVAVTIHPACTCQLEGRGGEGGGRVGPQNAVGDRRGGAMVSRPKMGTQGRAKDKASAASRNHV